MLPLSTIFSLGAAALGGTDALWLVGLETSIYAQIGVMLLIELAAKNAHTDRRVRPRAARRRPVDRPGRSHGRRAALLRGADEPLAFIFGVLPLALATGASANQAVGVTVLGGMLGATVIGLFIIPTLFAVIQWLTEALVGPTLRRLRPKRPQWAFSRRSRRADEASQGG